MSLPSRWPARGRARSSSSPTRAATEARRSGAGGRSRALQLEASHRLPVTGAAPLPPSTARPSSRPPASRGWPRAPPSSPPPSPPPRKGWERESRAPTHTHGPATRASRIPATRRPVARWPAAQAKTRHRTRASSCRPVTTRLRRLRRRFCSSSRHFWTCSDRSHNGRSRRSRNRTWSTSKGRCHRLQAAAAWGCSCPLEAPARRPAKEAPRRRPATTRP